MWFSLFRNLFVRDGLGMTLFSRSMPRVQVLTNNIIYKNLTRENGNYKTVLSCKVHHMIVGNTLKLSTKSF